MVLHTHTPIFCFSSRPYLLSRFAYSWYSIASGVVLQAHHKIKLETVAICNDQELAIGKSISRAKTDELVFSIILKNI